ncbi:MAG: TPM domain-containing protein, partial [Acutalibacteraceae bacterium]
DDFYDYNGYGFGANKDGILLLISREDWDCWMTTAGYGITAITDAGREYISGRVLSELNDGEYADACTTYAELRDEFITQAKTGQPYDIDHLPLDKGAYSRWLFELTAAIRARAFGLFYLLWLL